MKKKSSSIIGVVDILETVATSKHPPSPFDLDIPKPNIHRLLQRLEQEGFLKCGTYDGFVVGDRTYR